MSSVYAINRGVNRLIEFKGLQGQYIWWLFGGLLSLLFLFAVLYITGVNMVICILLVFGLGAGLFFYVYKISHQYGEYGMMKKLARKSIPKKIRCH